MKLAETLSAAERAYLEDVARRLNFEAFGPPINRAHEASRLTAERFGAPLDPSQLEDLPRCLRCDVIVGWDPHRRRLVHHTPTRCVSALVDEPTMVALGMTG